MRILVLGDVVGKAAVEELSKKLPKLKSDEKINVCIINGENASVMGISRKQAEELKYIGADLITLGNHSFSNRDILDYLDDERTILRPDNMSPFLPGRGWGVFDFGGVRALVVNLIGRCDMKFGPDNPFTAIDKILDQNKDVDLVLVDFHASATSEKRAMAFYLDGRATALWGTHTHVQTADEQVMDGGLGYITDVGMCGSRKSVIGATPSQSIKMFRGELQEKFTPVETDIEICGIIFDVDTNTGKCVGVTRVKI